MRRLREGMGGRLLVMAMVVMMVPALAPGEAAAEDVEVSTTFLTVFKNGGGYIEYRIKGQAAADLRQMIDDPNVTFPFETRLADGDGIIDQSEGEAYKRNLDDILTRRMIILRGVKMENVDVDEDIGLIGSKVDDKREIYLHITFRGGLQYDQIEFNVSGLEPLAVLYGSYEDIPGTLTVDERTYIVSAGMGAYETRVREEGTLLNMRAPLAAVVTYHSSYTVSSAPSARMEYDHSNMAANPLILMLFMLGITYFTIKLPKWAARDNDKERVLLFHRVILISVILFWLFYALGGNAYLVWGLGIALVVGSYAMGYQIYAKEWRGMAMDSEGIDLGEAISPIDPVNGTIPQAGPAVQGPAILGEGATGLEPYPEEDVTVAMPDDTAVLEAVDPSAAAPAYATDPPTAQEVPPPPAAPAPPAMPYPQQQPVQAATAPPVPAAVAAPQAVVKKQVVPVAQAAEPAPTTKAMRCKCGGVFRVPLQPRPLEVQCPHCGTTGTLRT
ncbi:MAG: hypothetical protein JSW25_00380 [Thermoplasmata archaeon]|nr:MAG: hypothetical protein JSW25_00380 [Thermoplasmata archaeon]